MSEKVADLEQVVELALKLSPLDKVHLVKRVVASLKQEFETNALATLNLTVSDEATSN